MNTGIRDALVIFGTSIALAGVGTWFYVKNKTRIDAIHHAVSTPVEQLKLENESAGTAPAAQRAPGTPPSPVAGASSTGDPAWDAQIDKFFAEPRNARFAQYDWAVTRFEHNMQIAFNEALARGAKLTDPQLMEAGRSMLVRDLWITHDGLVIPQPGHTVNPWDDGSAKSSQPESPWGQQVYYEQPKPAVSEEELFRSRMLREQQAQTQEMQEQTRIMQRQQWREQFGN